MARSTWENKDTEMFLKLKLDNLKGTNNLTRILPLVEERLRDFVLDYTAFNSKTPLLLVFYHNEHRREIGTSRSNTITRHA